LASENGSQHYTFPMNTQPALKLLAVALLSICTALPALAEWQWLDTDGKKVFSDRSPPPGTPEKNILKRPGVAPVPVSPHTVDGTEAVAAPAVPVAAPKVSGKDAQLEARKKLADDEATTKKKTEEGKVAKAKAENCESAKRYLTTLDSGVRIATVNAKGEREIMEDSQRVEAKKRTQEIAQSNCK
jgi:Domain of unknown function (DUF4124)